MYNHINYLNNQQKVYYLFLSFLYASVIIYSLVNLPINIIMNPAAISREDLYDFFMLFFLRPILFVFLIIFSIKYIFIHKILKTVLFTTITITTFVVSIKISSFLNESPISFYMLYSKISFCFIGLSLFAMAIRHGEYLDKVNVLVYLISLFVVALFWNIAVMKGWFFFDLTFDTLNITLNRLGTPLIVSTEFSNVCFLVLLLGLILMVSTRVIKILPLFIVILSGSIFMGYITIYQFSTGTYLAACFVFFLNLLNSWKRLAYLLIGATIFCICLLIFDNMYLFIKEYWILKSDDPGRLFIFSYLLESSLSNPWFGCGPGATNANINIYPHNNILGLWSELGLLPVIIYIAVFIINIYAVILYNIKKPFTSSTTHFILLASLFLHLKGFVHDTWQNEIIYIGFGLQVSVISYIYSNKHLTQKIRLPI
jgi:hypothetical protein